MAMPLVKAKEILKSYKDHDYTGSKALEAVGYSRSTATKSQVRTLDSAVNAIVAAGDNDAILEYLGITDEDIAKEYLFIVNQKKDMSSKLKALQPLLARKGIKWSDDKSVITPTVNITMKGNVEAPLNRAVGNVAQSLLCDIDNTAQLGSETETVQLDHGTPPGFGSPDQIIKEEESPSSKISEKDTIDKNTEISSNKSAEASDEIPDSFTE